MVLISLSRASPILFLPRYSSCCVTASAMTLAPASTPILLLSRCTVRFVQHNIPPSVLGKAATCIYSQLIVRRVTTQYPVPHYDWCSSQSSSGCHGTRQSSSSGRNGEVAQQSPDDSSEGVLANGSSANSTSISGTDPGQNTQSTAISHQSSQSNESWSSASDEDHQDQSSRPSGSDCTSFINATSTTKAAPFSSRDPVASDNQGFQGDLCPQVKVKPELAPRFGKRAKPSAAPLSTDQLIWQFVKFHLR